MQKHEKIAHYLIFIVENNTGRDFFWKLVFILKGDNSNI